MKNPWMPLYVADYLADTTHLSTAQHGAYLLLIMHYWRQSGLPKTDDELARIARMSRHEWSRARKIIAAFFDENWHHLRIENELSHAQEVTRVRRETGARGGRAKALKDKEVALANATDLPPTLPPHLPDVCHSKSPSKKVHLSHTLPNGKVTESTLPNGKAGSPGSAPNGATRIVTRIKPETAAYNRCKKILGDKFGGKVAKELIAHSSDDIDNVFQALKRIEEASNPRAYATAILDNYEHPAATDDWIT